MGKTKDKSKNRKPEMVYKKGLLCLHQLELTRINYSHYTVHDFQKNH